jgi:hypothetical protein
MPVATIDPNATENFELETLEEGEITLRRMSFSAFLHRQDIMMKMQIEAKEKGDPVGMTMSMGNLETALFEFKECLVDHNLTDANGNKLDFTKASTFKILDPRVGEEVQDKIQKMNRYLEESHLGNSGPASGPAS